MVQYIKNHPVISFIVLIIILLIPRIIYWQLNKIDYNINVKGITVSKSFERLSIMYEENISLQEIIDDSILYGLNPAMDLEEFDSLFGIPFSIRKENETINIYEYRTKIGEVIVCDGYEKYDEGIELIRCLEIRPINIYVNNVFSEPIAKIIRDNEDILYVTIEKKNQLHNDYISIQITNGFIDFIVWSE